MLQAIKSMEKRFGCVKGSECVYCKKLFTYEESDIFTEHDYEVGSGGPITESSWVKCPNCGTRKLLADKVVG